MKVIVLPAPHGQLDAPQHYQIRMPNPQMNKNNELIDNGAYFIVTEEKLKIQQTSLLSQLHNVQEQLAAIDETKPKPEPVIEEEPKNELVAPVIPEISNFKKVLNKIMRKSN